MDSDWVLVKFIWFLVTMYDLIQRKRFQNIYPFDNIVKGIFRSIYVCCLYRAFFNYKFIEFFPEEWRHFQNLTRFVFISLPNKPEKHFTNLKATQKYRWFFPNRILFARFICSFDEFCFLRSESNKHYNLFTFCSRWKAFGIYYFEFLYDPFRRISAPHVRCLIWKHFLRFSLIQFIILQNKFIIFFWEMNQLFEFNFWTNRNNTVAYHFPFAISFIHRQKRSFTSKIWSEWKKKISLL